MKPVLVARHSLFFALLFSTAWPAEEMTAYRYGGSARASVFLGKYDEALDSFNRSIALKPDPVIYSQRGDLKAKLKDFAGAIADYDKAIALKPNDLASYYGSRGGINSQSGNYDRAIADYDQVISLQPDQAVAYNNRGVARSSKGDYDGAIADYAKAIALEPANVGFYANRAGSYLSKGNLDRAITDYDQIVRLEPDEASHYFTRADLKQQKGDLDGTIADYSEVCELMPEHVNSFFKLAITRHAKGELEAALTDYAKTLALAKDAEAIVTVYREVALRQLRRSTPFAELVKTVTKWKDGWDKNIGLYLVDALSGQALLTRASEGNTKTVPARLCSANYFIGMTKLLADDKATARKYFEQCVASGLINVDEFILARAELSRLTAKP